MTNIPISPWIRISQDFLIWLGDYFLDKMSFCSLGWPRTHYVVHGGFRHTAILLPQPWACWVHVFTIKKIQKAIFMQCTWTKTEELYVVHFGEVSYKINTSLALHDSVSESHWCVVQDILMNSNFHPNAMNFRFGNLRMCGMFVMGREQCSYKLESQYFPCLNLW